MANKFCTQCGALAIAGKRFCTQCGQPIVHPETLTGNSGSFAGSEPIQPPSSLAEPLPAVVSEPSSEVTAPAPVEETQAQKDFARFVELPPAAFKQFCTKCGSPVISGKRFCIQCGQPVTAVTTPMETTATSTSAEAVQKTPNFLAPFPVVTAAAVVPESIADAGPVLTTSPQVDESVSGLSASKAAVQKISWRIPVLVAGVVACVLGIAITGVWLHISRAKPVPALPPPPVATGIASQSTPPVAGGGAASNDKPSAAMPSGTEGAAPGHQEHEQQQHAVRPPLSAGNEPGVAAGNKGSSEVTTATIPKSSPIGQSEALHTRPSPEAAIAPAPRSSGTLHYSGTPVRYGEDIVFPNLPGARLRFTFDHQLWQPLISRQPDGTQKLTLRSLKQGEQAQCDVGWEIIN
jgi:uncharacterized OB-fold protein